jgi:hypothetical protein
MGLTSSPPNSDSARGSDSAPQSQDYNPRTFVYSDEARQLLETPPRSWNPRDFTSDEDEEHWWEALAIYGAIVLVAGVLTALGELPWFVMAVAGIALAIFLALAVLAYLGMEVGLAVFAAGITMIVASLPGLSYFDPGGVELAQFALVLGGGLCLALGLISTLFWRHVDLAADDAPSQGAV